jgi:uncharacterized protein (TIGR03083 family)
MTMDSTRLTFDEYLDHLDRETARFREVLVDAPADARVPTCPDWDAVDLLWHLGEVQDFWAKITAGRLQTSDEVEEIERTRSRPGERGGVQAFFDDASRRLHDALRSTPPETPAWTWSDEQTVGFSYRRQAHEALIHRLDAELTAGAERRPIDAVLAADGIDEGLRIMFGGLPEWGTKHPDGGRTFRVRATDTGHTWLVELVRFTGTSPEGKEYDEPDIEVYGADDGRDADATVSGTAADVDCWLWNRPAVGEVSVTGDPAVCDAVTTLLGQPIT